MSAQQNTVPSTAANSLMSILAAALLLSSTMLHAQEPRHIHLNGEHLSPQDILLMDQLFGYTVANNFYWLNTETGEWGYENDPQTQGVLQAVVDHQVSQQQAGGNTPRNEIYYDPDPGRSAVRGRLNGQDCTFVSSGGMTFKSCD
jgi:hypothetical protein